ncbi:hypothetical protein [Cellulosilyticum sp. I15G10I2]|uniref:hypothetical protein n=1 Tax=Cellulosilyticum sp. I15G10I2 TaxID=1892843 RepID=UPI00085BD76C|nr:hypothetical protein [Cellulosilyticum sp. I15G10I2]
MDKYYDVMERLLELLNTLEEGILHIQSQLKELQYEEALFILQDVMEGIASIENALEPMASNLAKNNIKELENDLITAIAKTVASYEQENEINLEKQIEQGVTPTFMRWKEEIEGILQPYIIS